MNKDEILKACFDLVHKKIEEVNMAIQTANHSLVEEDKSSAGDKYETGREMIQQDLNRYEQQLKNLTQDLDLLQRIQQSQETRTDAVGLGSLVKTDKSIFFLACSIGVVPVGKNTIYCISLVSPIGQVLQGKKEGENFAFNGVEHQILSLS